MPMSQKQKEILQFPHMTGYSALICDGAIRTGKTSWMALSFILWAMNEFRGRKFAICSKSVGAAERNIIMPLLEVRYLRENFEMMYLKSRHELVVKKGKKENRFFVFGGMDEGSAALIQGVTLAGALLDEVVLMPESFVKQATARCSVENSRIWFSCNPEGPYHWFKREWIDHAEEKGAKYIHFDLDDNPGLSETIKARYRARYTGVFYRRFILGEWVQASGAVYPNFSAEVAGYHGQLAEGDLWGSERFIAVDFGVHNPTAMLDLYLVGSDVYQDGEYYYNSREETEEQRPQKTTGEYYEELVKLVESRKFHMMQGQYQVERVKEPTAIIIDPSASAMIAEIESHGRFLVIKADNEVLAGIRATASMIAEGRYHINLDRCQATVKEFYSYVWDEKAKGEDKPVKENDHAMDALRYFTQTIYVNERGLLYDGR